VLGNDSCSSMRDDFAVVNVRCDICALGDRDDDLRDAADSGSLEVVAREALRVLQQDWPITDD